MKILVSACLLGENCKYNGGNNYCEEVAKLAEEHTLMPVCPEYFGGLPIPRPPAEIVDGIVVNKEGEVITGKFLDGAEKTQYIAEEAGCRIAILKENSPSCGFGRIYDGTFTGTLTNGNGITAQRLYNSGITVIGEKHLEKLKDYI